MTIIVKYLLLHSKYSTKRKKKQEMHTLQASKQARTKKMKINYLL